MSSESWPPKLKEWVAKCLGKMTDANRTEAQTELRKVIADSYASKTLWTTDWDGLELESLRPKPPPQINNLKRKSAENSVAAKKTKKNKPSSTASTTVEFNDQLALNRRAARFSREHEIEKQKSSGNLFTNLNTLKANQNNSHLFNNSRSASPYMEDDSSAMDWDKHAIVGTSTSIFKDYLRLTSEPRPEQIRPFAILEKTLPELKQRWRVDSASANAERDPTKAKEIRDRGYHWVCSQFKSLRQDLVVQRIKNEFTVHVYETHARIALEMSDMVEYNACAAMLRNLYSLGIPGKQEEFAAYRILDFLHGRNHHELNMLVGRLTPPQKAHKAISHALKVQRALSTANYHALFALYDEAPFMSGYIMDHFITRERARAMVIISKSYMNVSVSFLTSVFKYEDSSRTYDFLDKHNSAGFFTNPNVPLNDRIFDCRAAQATLAQAYEEKYRRVQIHGAV